MNLRRQERQRNNSYLLGQIHHYNIIIVSLPSSVYDTTPVVTVGENMLWTFPSISFGLPVVFGVAAPLPTHNIRLGDVVVHESCKTSGAVIYDSTSSESVAKHRSLDSTR